MMQFQYFGIINIVFITLFINFQFGKVTKYAQIHVLIIVILIVIIMFMYILILYIANTHSFKSFLFLKSEVREREASIVHFAESKDQKQ